MIARLAGRVLLALAFTLTESLWAEVLYWLADL